MHLLGKNVPKRIFGVNPLFAEVCRGRKYGPVFFTFSRLQKSLVHHNTNSTSRNESTMPIPSYGGNPIYPHPVRPQVVPLPSMSRTPPAGVPSELVPTGLSRHFHQLQLTATSHTKKQKTKKERETKGEERSNAPHRGR